MKARALALIAMISVGVSVGVGVGVSASWAAEPPHVLSLDEAERIGLARQPTVIQAEAAAEAAAARADESRAPLLPQVVGAAAYQRTTANIVARPGVSLPSPSTTSRQTFGYYSASLTLSQLLWDFGQTSDRWRAAREGARAQAAGADAQRQQALLLIRTSYFAAQSARELAAVAHEAVQNSDRHLVQVQAFVDVGTRPEIDLAQARTLRANAEVQVIQAENNYVAARAELNAAMGLERGTDYDVSDTAWAPLPGETGGVEALVAAAFAARPDVRAAEVQLLAQALTLRAVRSGYWPALFLGGNATDAGTSPDRLTWNWSAQLGLSWTLFQGALTPAQIREQAAQLRAVTAARDAVRLAARLEVVQAENAVRAQRAITTAASQALASARSQLALAEARYQAGLGSALELDDAQLAATNAAAQQVVARQALSSARALLAKAIGVFP
jgi:outer membrane protein